MLIGIQAALFAILVVLLIRKFDLFGFLIALIVGWDLIAAKLLGFERLPAPTWLLVIVFLLVKGRGGETGQEHNTDS